MTATTIALQEDTRLVTGIQKGDQQALSELYNKYAPALMGIICKIVPHEKMAEAILQHTFLLAWQQLDTSQICQSSIFTCLLRLARSTAISNIKLQQPNLTASDFVNGSADSQPEQDFSVTRQNTIFDLLYCRGLGYHEVALLLKIPVQEVKNHFRQAVKNKAVVKIL